MGKLYYKQISYPVIWGDYGMPVNLKLTACFYEKRKAVSVKGTNGHGKIVYRVLQTFKKDEKPNLSKILRNCLSEIESEARKKNNLLANLKVGSNRENKSHCATFSLERWNPEDTKEYPIKF
jgi:hypothetical protein